METSHTLTKWQRAGSRKDGHDRTYYKPGISYFATKHKHPGFKKISSSSSTTLAAATASGKQSQHEERQQLLLQQVIEATHLHSEWRDEIRPVSKDMSTVTAFFPCLSQGTALKTDSQSSSSLTDGLSGSSFMVSPVKDSPVFCS